MDVHSNFKKMMDKSTGNTDNDIRDAIRNVLNAATQGPQKEVEALFNQALYTLKNLGKRMWFDFGMMKCKRQLDWGALNAASATLEELHNACRKPNGEDDTSKGGHLLEIYAVKFEIAEKQGLSAAIDDLYSKTHNLAADVNDAKVMCIIHECWGKYWAHRNMWEDAYKDFYQSFKMFNESGDPRSARAIKYAVVANILADSEEDPFALREAGSMKSNESVAPIVRLREAFETDDIHTFGEVLRTSEEQLTSDPFIKKNVVPLFLQLRSKVLLKLVQPYDRIKMDFLCRQLIAKPDEVESLVVSMILDGRINGKLDQFQNILDLSSGKGDALQKALGTWAETLGRLKSGLSNRASKISGRMGGGSSGFAPFSIDDDERGPGGMMGFMGGGEWGGGMGGLF